MKRHKESLEKYIEDLDKGERNKRIFDGLLNPSVFTVPILQEIDPFTSFLYDQSLTTLRPLHQCLSQGHQGVKIQSSDRLSKGNLNYERKPVIIEDIVKAFKNYESVHQTTCLDKLIQIFPSDTNNPMNHEFIFKKTKKIDQGSKKVKKTKPSFLKVLNVVPSKEVTNKYIENLEWDPKVSFPTGLDTQDTLNAEEDDDEDVAEILEDSI